MSTLLSLIEQVSEVSINSVRKSPTATAMQVLFIRCVRVNAVMIVSLIDFSLLHCNLFLYLISNRDCGKQNR